MRSAKRKNRRLHTTIQGVIALAEWSDSSDEAEVVLLTDDDDEYYIDSHDSSIRPSRYINSRVEASGRVYERDDRTVLLVRRMRVVESFHGVGDDMYDDDVDDDDYEDAGNYEYLFDDAGIDDYSRLIKSQRFD